MNWLPVFGFDLEFDNDHDLVHRRSLSAAFRGIISHRPTPTQAPLVSMGDSDGLRRLAHNPIDRRLARELLPRSRARWRHRKVDAAGTSNSTNVPLTRQKS
jgi:hypothetical protein